MDKKRLVLIDFSSLLYSVSYNCSADSLKTDNFSEYKNTLDFYVQSIFDDTKADYYLCFGDGFTSFRKEEFKDYKGNRDKTVVRKFITDLKHYATEKYKIIYDEKLESDDMILVTANNLKDEYDIIIASKDSDLRQLEGLYYNYGWRLPLYKDKSSKPSELDLKLGLENAFEVITKEKAEFNLWYNVLTKGHNNKPFYLEGCGDKTAEAYLNSFKSRQYNMAVFNAFINGIDKVKYNTSKTIRGYGLMKGIELFNKSFRGSYLLRHWVEHSELGSLFDISEYKVNEIPKVDTLNMIYELPD